MNGNIFSFDTGFGVLHKRSTGEPVQAEAAFAPARSYASRAVSRRQYASTAAGRPSPTLRSKLCTLSSAQVGERGGRGEDGGGVSEGARTEEA